MDTLGFYTLPSVTKGNVIRNGIEGSKSLDFQNRRIDRSSTIRGSGFARILMSTVIGYQFQLMNSQTEVDKDLNTRIRQKDGSHSCGLFSS